MFKQSRQRESNISIQPIWPGSFAGPITGKERNSRFAELPGLFYISQKRSSYAKSANRGSI